MLRILDDGENRFRLENETGADVGWIRGHSIGFRGLPDETAAIEAGVDSSRALERSLASEFPGYEVRYIGTSGIRLVHDGAYEWVADGNRPLARLLRPAFGAVPEKTFGIELVLPSYSTSRDTIACAHAVWRAIEPRLRVTSRSPVSSERPSRVFPYRRGPSHVFGTRGA